MHMCITTMASVIIMVFAITFIACLIGKLNKFGDNDSIIKIEEDE